MPTSFSLTFDYLCPWARIVHEHVVDGLQAGADWDVTFTPYSLMQGHVEPGDPSVWEQDDPNAARGVLALQVGLAVRDHVPDRFLDAHREIYSARHDRGEDLGDRDVLAKALAAVGVDAAEVFALVDSGALLGQLREEHERNVDEHTVWGVPTFIAGGRAVFMRLLDRTDDPAIAVARIDRILDLVVNMPELHEFKQTDLPR